MTKFPAFALNGQAVPFEGLAEAPATPDGRWTFRCRVEGDLVLWAFRDLAFGNVDAHRCVINANRDLTAPPLRLRFEGDSGFPNLMGSTEGYAWTDPSYIAFRGGSGSTPFDHVADQLVASGGEDVDVTRYTGSANMEFHHWAGLVGRRYGASRSILSLLYAYLRKQFRRPRWFLRNGLPDGIDGSAAEPVAHFNEWREDHEGLNAFDAQHLDGTELYWGWKLTGDPAFAVALIQLWLSARWNSYYIRHPEKLWAGSVRVPGWWGILSAFVLEVAKELPLTAIAIAVQDSVEAHFRALDESFPVYNPYEHGGSQKPWMLGPVQLAIVRLIDLGFDLSRTGAKVREWLNARAYRPSDGAIAYRVKPEGTTQVMDSFGPWGFGVFDWYAGGASVLENPGQPAEAVTEHLIEAGVTDPAHPYHLSRGVGMIPLACGYEGWR